MKATRCYFLPSSSPPYFREALATFDFTNGQQADIQSRNSNELLRSIRLLNPGKTVLEVSTASSNPLGVRLSALNLQLSTQLGRFSVEQVFQASKVFQGGGPFVEILSSSSSPKSHSGLRESGRLLGFKSLDGEFWPADGTSNYYDNLYFTALLQDPSLLEQIKEFEIFTDVRFTKNSLGFRPNKPINTQARSCAIASGLYMTGGIEAISDFTKMARGTGQAYSIQPLFNLPD